MDGGSVPVAPSSCHHRARGDGEHERSDHQRDLGTVGTRGDARWLPDGHPRIDGLGRHLEGRLGTGSHATVPALLLGPECDLRSRLLADALAGLRYTWRNRTLRGLGFAVTFGNLSHGMTTIVLPLIVLQRFGLNAAVVGLVFAASGISGVASAFFFGRVDTRGREWSMLVWPMVALIPVVGLLLVAAGVASVPVGVAVLVVHMVLVGLLLGEVLARGLLAGLGFFDFGLLPLFFLALVLLGVFARFRPLVVGRLLKDGGLLGLLAL